MTVATAMKSKVDTRQEQYLRILLASGGKERLAQLAVGLWTLTSCVVDRAASTGEVLARLAEGQVDLVVIDHQLADLSGLDLAKDVARLYPFVNCIMVDDSDPAEFHEKTEGLGILMQLPNPPEMGDAKSILTHLRIIGEMGQADSVLQGRSV